MCLKVVVSQRSNSNQLLKVHAWNHLEFDYANGEDRQKDIDAGLFVLNVPAPIDVDVYYSSDNNVKIFVAMPRFAKGIPITFGTVTKRKFDGNPVITPYPNWSWNRNLQKPCNAERMISVFRVKTDECGRLWVLDAGRIANDLFCHPQIMAFDLKTDKRINNYEIPATQYESRSIFVTPIIEVIDSSNQCKKSFVYMADCQAYAIVVYDLEKNKSWRIIDKTFYPYPTFGTFRIEGDQFDLLDGILGMDLSPYIPGRDRKLYYHALSSNTENWVYTAVLRNESLFESDPQSSPQLFHSYPETRLSQSAAMAIDKNGISYFANMNDTTIMCWNTQYHYGGEHLDIIEKNKIDLQFPSGIKVIRNNKGKQELWAITTSFQKIMAGTLSMTGQNFRIMAGKIAELVKGKRCVD